MSVPGSTTAVKGSIIDFNCSPDKMHQGVLRLLAKERALLDKVALEPYPTFANTVAPINHMDDEHDSYYRVNQLLSELSPDQTTRNAAKQTVMLVNEFSVECSMRKDIYRQVLAVYKDSQEMARLCSEDRLLVEKMVVRYRKSGLLLPEPQQRRLRDINALVDHAISAFSICVNNSTPQLLFSRLELDGLPDSFFAGRATADQPGGAVVVAKYVVSLTKCNVAAILRSAAMENTRKAVYVAVNTRCPENIQRLQDTVDLRQEKARILSYESHSHLVLEGLAAKSPQGVLRMLNDLHERLKPRAQRELQMLGAMKRSDCESSGRPYVGFFEWDAAYYMRIATERTHQVNSANVKQYFPVAGTVARMLGLAEQLLGLRFVRAERPNAWHTAVELYEVWGSSGFLGHCYMDLFSRPGKYTGAANIVIRSGFTRPNGTREFPAVALVTNFAPPPLSTIDSPSLLSHANVKTLFHELGHALHHLCSHTKWSVFHGTNVSRDFLECPSQLMENLVWEPSVLRKLGKHHQSGEPIPENIIGWLVAARNQYPGIFYLSKVFRATYDITIYSAPPDTVVDVRGLLQEMEKDIALCNTGGVETISAATVRHFMRGYDSRCYVYLYGQALGADLFITRMLAGGVDNRSTWVEYRDCILRPGGSCNIMARLRVFLGREPNNSAFFKQIGLD